MLHLSPFVVVIALIILSEKNVHVNAFRIFEIDGKETILASENENIKIECKSDYPMTYCGFVHPSGKRFSFAERAVSDGKCVQKIKATKADSGEWGCHIGTKSYRLETIKKITVRIVNEVAAIEPLIIAKLGKSITISCATTKGLIPLNYCRFEPPNGQSFNIDSSVTAENSILKKYYYPSNSSLDRGDCAVTISKVKYEDMGDWTCGAGLDDGKEYFDVITLEVEGMNTLSTASTAGITFGGILIAVTLGSLGYIAWKKRRLLGQRSAAQEEIEIEDMSQQRSSSPEPRRSVPMVVVQSPSDAEEPGSSPLMPSS